MSDPVTATAQARGTTIVSVGGRNPFRRDDFRRPLVRRTRTRKRRGSLQGLGRRRLSRRRVPHHLPLLRERTAAYREQIEVGEWAISGPVYFLSTKGWVDGDTFLKADSTSPDLYDAYRIISLEPKLFEYEHFVSGNRYQVRRVNSNFVLPE